MATSPPRPARAGPQPADGAPRVTGRPRVVVTRRLLPATEARMAELFDAAFNPDDAPLGRAALVAAMRGADVIVPTVTDRIDAAMLAEACADGGRLGLIANFGAGIDHLALGAARAHGVMVTNTPGVYTDDTADMTIALIILARRRIAEGMALMRRGGWHGWAPDASLGHSLAGARLAILGMGRIGQAVAHRARGFGLEIVYHNRHRLPAALETTLGARYAADIDALVAQADILTLHCPAGPATRGVLSAARIAAMRPGACVVNTARGELIDEAALIAALASGRLAAAALDVFVQAPTVNPRLLALPQVVTTPHLASATVEGRIASGERVIANVRFWADGHRPPDQVLEGWA